MFIAGIAKNERELFSRLVSAMVGGSTVGRYAVSGTGNGQLHGLHVPESLFGTLITLTCTVAGTNDAEFSVDVGGTGVASATTHTPYNYQGLNFMIGMGSTAWAVNDTITIAADGSSTLTTQEVYVETFVGSVEEDLTIQCTTASTAGAGAEFSVTGSVSGLLGTVTQGTRTDFTGYTVTVPEGHDFLLTDAVVYPFRASELPSLERWEILHSETAPIRWDTNETEHDQLELITFRGRGTTGTENIYIELSRFGLIDRHSNWRFGGMTGWDDAIDHTMQQGYIPVDEQPCVTMQHELMTFYISVTGRRIMGAIGSSDVHNHFYAGFLQGHQSPTHYPYPLFIGGSNVPAGLEYDLGADTGYYQKQVSQHAAYWNPVVYNGNPIASQALAYTFNDTYEVIGNRSVNTITNAGLSSTAFNNNERIVSPYGMDGMSRMRANFDGSYTPVPVWLAGVREGMKTVMGRFDGLMAISSDNGQQSGNVLESNDVYHIVLNNTYNQGANDYCMIEVK